MKVGLFIPCIVNELYGDVAMSTLELLEKLDVDVEYPMEQTCCGQVSSTMGCKNDFGILAERFLNIFKKYDYVVAPSSSCVAIVRENYEPFLKGKDGFEHLRTHTYELCEFLHDVLKITTLNASFNHKIGVHNSCHGQRKLNLGTPSERNLPENNKIKNLLNLVAGTEIADIKRPDECCGFGGVFAVMENGVSSMMGDDRVMTHVNAGVEVVTGADMSCLMHMEGIAKRNKYPLKFMHISQILNGEVPNGTS